MAPEHIVVRLTAVPEVRLNEQPIAWPLDTPKRIAEQFLSHLPAIKANLRCRCTEAMVDEPETLAHTCLSCLARARWAKRAGDYYARVYPDGVALAEAMLGSRDEAEDAAQDAFIPVLTGESEPQHYLRRVKFKCYDRLKKKSPESYDAWQRAEEALAGMAEDEEDHFEPMSDDPEGGYGSPDEVLLARQERRELARLLELAKQLAATERKYRWIKRKRWAEPLGLRRK